MRIELPTKTKTFFFSIFEEKFLIMKKIGKGCILTCVIFLSLILILLVIGNISTPSLKKENTIQTEQSLDEIISRLKNASSVKSFAVKDSVLTLEFVSNYDEYKTKNPNSKIKKNEYNNIWSDKEVKKTLISAVGKIFEKEPSIKSVETSKNYKGKNYKILVTRDRFEVFEYHIVVNANLRLGETFSDKYVYNDKGRELFYGYFVK